MSVDAKNEAINKFKLKHCENTQMKSKILMLKILNFYR